jgi:hypothetical protein
MGVRVGISAEYRPRTTPSSGKKSNAFTGHWSSVETMPGESKASEKSKSKIDQQSCDRLFSQSLLVLKFLNKKKLIGEVLNF